MEKHPTAYAIEALMKECDTNPKRLAKSAGVGETYIRDIIKGRSLDPQTGKLVKVASALSCSLDDLVLIGKALRDGASFDDLKGRLKASGPDPARQALYAEQEFALVELWRELSPSQRSALLSFIEATVGRRVA